MATQEAPPAWQPADAPPADIPTQAAPPTGQTTTTSSGGEFGSSEFGQRLDFTQPKYQDLWAFICFYVHIVLIIILAIVFWTSAGGSEATPAPTLPDQEEVEVDINFGGFIVGLICAAIAGVLFGMLWLQCIKKFAESIIKILLFTSIACWVLLAVFGLAIGAIPLTVIGIIFALIMCLYTYCVWGRIPFAGACLSIASKVVIKYPGVVWCACLAVVLIWIWNVISIACISGYIASTYDTLECDYVRDEQGQIVYETDDNGTRVPKEECTGGPNNLVMFLLFISYYWGINVWSNVSHTTTCGVAAAWYFNPGVLQGPVSAAFRRTMTTSFGSICFGSLIVAILQAIRSMLRMNKNNQCAQCLLACIERIMRFFNKYAFAQVAIYGSSFIEAARATWDLFLSKGILAIINDDLSGMVLTCGAVLGAVVSAVVGFFIGSAFYGLDTVEGVVITIVLAFFCFFLGWYVVGIMLTTVASGVVAVFVCYSEDPAACATNRPKAFAKLTSTSPKMAEVAVAEGVQVTGQQPPPQQA